jgi:hypothetical protein
LLPFDRAFLFDSLRPFFFFFNDLSRRARVQSGAPTRDYLPGQPFRDYDPGRQVETPLCF